MLRVIPSIGGLLDSRVVQFGIGVLKLSLKVQMQELHFEFCYIEIVLQMLNSFTIEFCMDILLK